MVSSKIKNISALGLSNFLASSINAVFWIYLATILEKTEYSEVVYLMAFAASAVAFSNFGLDQTIIVYGTKKQKIFSPVFQLSLITSTIAAFIIYFITNNIFIILLIFLNIIFIQTQSLLTSEQRHIDRSKFRIIRSVLLVIFSIGLYYLMGINGIVLGFALSSLVSLINLRNLRFRFRDMLLLKSKIHFMSLAWLGNLGNKLLWWGDKIIIGSIMSLSIVGSYHIATQFVFLLWVIPSAFGLFLLPEEVLHRKNIRVKKYFVIFSIVIAVTSIIIIPYLIQLVLPEYQESILPIQIMSFSIVPMTISFIYESQFLGSENPKPRVFASLIQLAIYFPLLILLGNQFGIVGMAVGFLISSIGKTLFYIFFSRYSIKIN